MKLYIINHKFHYEMENLTRIFFPNEKIEKFKELPQDISMPCIITDYIQQDKGSVEISVSAYFSDNEIFQQKSVVLPCNDFDTECERTMAELLFKILCRYTGQTPPWGILTGVRPIKLFRRLSEEMGKENAEKYFMEKFFVSKEKTELAVITESNEKAILDLSTKQSFSVYISIPFCPSRCSYCSFVSQSIEKAKKLIEPYLELLCKEIEQTAQIAQKLNLKLETIYIGGGTPTTLSAMQLKKLIDTVNRCFDMNICREFTVEAGRPDTITADKLKVMANGGVNRISINPQTLSDDVLRVIGRKHTAEQTLNAFELARKIGFKHINMDLIAGLPTDTFINFSNTLDKIIELDPESITVHTLAMKKSSSLTTEGASLVLNKDAQEAVKMHQKCKSDLLPLGYRPYYLYRQSRMVGNLENIGYAKKGYDGLYNVFVMDETHTIFGCGAGAVTKLKQYGTNYLERICNYKYPFEYIDDFAEMIKRKDRYIPFYKEFF